MIGVDDMTSRRELTERVEKLEAEVAELREQLAAKSTAKPRTGNAPKGKVNLTFDRDE